MSGMHAHHPHTHSNAGGAESRGQLTSRAAIASVAMALILVGIKAWAAWHTDSTAMLGSLVDTALDLIASLITLVGVRVAAMPADDQHRFGHGKAESLVALIQVIVVSMSAVGIGWRAIGHLSDGSVTKDAEYGIGVSLFATALTLALLAYQRQVIRKTGSVAIQADNLHYKSDLALNAAVIVALVLDHYLRITGADAFFGIIIALWLLYGAWRTADHVLGQLMDKEWPTERKRHLIDIVMLHPQAKGVHDIRTRTSGAHEFVQFHLWVKGSLTVTQAHDIMDEIEASLHSDFPGVEFLIHPDPEGHQDDIGFDPSEISDNVQPD